MVSACVVDKDGCWWYLLVSCVCSDNSNIENISPLDDSTLEFKILLPVWWWWDKCQCWQWPVKMCVVRVRLILVFREMICSMRSTTTLALLRCVRSFIFRRLHLQNSFESYNSTQNVNTLSLGPGSDWCDQAAGRPLPLHWQVEGKQIGTHCSTIFLGWER